MLQCDIIIPVQNRLDLTKDCVRSISRYTHIPFGLVIIDNASSDETSRFLKELEAANTNVTVIRNQTNLGWVKAVNQGMKRSVSPYVVIMNNDTIVKTDDWLSKLIRLAESETDIGLVNPSFGMKKKDMPGSQYIEVDFCRGYCMLIKRAVIEKIGFLDEAYGLGYYDDDDYSVRAIKANFRCMRANGVFVEHLGDSTFNAIFKDEKRHALHERNKMLFYSKWGRRLKIVFIFTKEVDEKAISGILFPIARRQHIVFVWTIGRELSFAHINIRGKGFSRLFAGMFFFMKLLLNRVKTKASKRYDIVFVDDSLLKNMISVIGLNIYQMDIRNDAARINEIIDGKSRL